VAPPEAILVGLHRGIELPTTSIDFPAWWACVDPSLFFSVVLPMLLRLCNVLLTKCLLQVRVAVEITLPVGWASLDLHAVDDFEFFQTFGVLVLGARSTHLLACIKARHTLRGQNPREADFEAQNR